MQSLTLCLIRRYDEDVGPLTYAHHLRCYILVALYQGVASVVEEESLIVERAESPFLRLNSIGAICNDLDVQGVWAVNI